MKGNIKICHLLMNRYKFLEIHIGESTMKSSGCGNPLGMKID